MTRSLLVLGFLSSLAVAGPPPLMDIIRETLRNRVLPVFEVQLLHRISAADGVTYAVEERIIQNRNETSVIWRLPGMPSPVWVRLGDTSYEIQNGPSFPITNRAWITYLTTESPEVLRSSLQKNGFISADQFQQFQDDYQPQGDPQTWKTQASYIRRSTISLGRLTPLPFGFEGIGIRVMGPEVGGARKMVFFSNDPQRRTIKGFKDGDKFWVTEGAQADEKVGHYPTQLTYFVNNAEVIKTEMQKFGPISPKARSEAIAGRNRAKETSVTLTPEAEASLKLLLSFR